MAHDFDAWLNKPFRTAGKATREKVLSLQDRLDMYADINDELDKLIYGTEQDPHCTTDIHLLYSKVRERARQGEELLCALANALQSPQKLPHSVEKLRIFAVTVQEDQARDDAFGSYLWQKFDLYRPCP